MHSELVSAGSSVWEGEGVRCSPHDLRWRDGVVMGHSSTTPHLPVRVQGCHGKARDIACGKATADQILAHTEEDGATHAEVVVGDETGKGLPAARRQQSLNLGYANGLEEA